MAPQPIRIPDSATATAESNPQPNEANKPNASTGPKTPEGKAKSAQNSFKHGLASGTLLIQGESIEEWEAFLQTLHTEWLPASPTEELLFTDMAKHHWLKDRAVRLQNKALCGVWGITPDLGVLLRYQTTNERAFFRAKKELEIMQKLRGKFVSQNQAVPSDLQFVSQSEPEPATALAEIPVPADPTADPKPVKRSHSSKPLPQKPVELTADAEKEARAMAAELKMPFPNFMELFLQPSAKSLNK